ncbi:alginate O-acetyltransferase complex protein AlgI [Hymenobacter daecheongensis DSM 21074]|uniref:Alginate O-acetyltransferase complex protein AlgI n=1 Tax=Hymenobacter daecheongensis DSM 21074 TaxID=1121955 RepID=A0A1M6IP63_9BACT|nr:MBOAT family protein [Hymenobacter daecheongensis]SHJ36205.1 alginate O-acetyltransferase complex protein AlgI [Hymenobacter daecheongensis DSM 21074]
MVFSSTLFLFYFFPAFLLLYYLAPIRLKNFVALTASLLFYAWGGINFLALFLASVVLNFFIIRLMDASQGYKKRIYLILSIILNVAMLFYFKYANFFLENFSAVKASFGGGALTWEKVVLPIGISFFTFEKLTYSIDVYRGVNKPLRSFWDFMLYIMLFPKMIAGPIVRFHEIADQLTHRAAFETIDHKLAGLFRFVIGLSKKVLIANVLGQEADRIFGLAPAELSAPLAWLGALAYTFQIYFDFSGYSDMAIGIGRMIGFQFPENFNNPYISRSITEFWQRWHITLGRWMRDYLYIPLGGNRVKPSRLYVNLWTVFILSGFWHGAAWNFIAWGAFHGLFLILDRLFLLNLYKRLGVLSILPTFLITVVGWVLFRAESLGEALAYVRRMFGGGLADLPHFTNEFWVTLALATLFAFMAALPRVERWELGTLAADKLALPRAVGMSLATAILLILSVSYIIGSSFNPFIYFRF